VLSARRAVRRKSCASPRFRKASDAETARAQVVRALLHLRCMKASIESAGGVASRVQLGAHTLTFDQPATVPGGGDRGPSPLDVLVVSVGACAHYFAAAFLHGRQLPVDGLRVEVEAQKGRTPSPRVERLSVRVTVPAGVPEHYLPSIERAIRNCPAYGTLVHPPDVELTVHKDPPEKLTLAS
jgi:putative redox protein